MIFKEAIEILNVPAKFTNHDLKKAYHKKALQFHPDKNSETEETFKEINEAYIFLQENSNQNTQDDNFFFQIISIIRSFIYNKNFFKEIINKLSKENLIQILKVFQKNQSLLNIDEQIIQLIYIELQKKLQKDTVYILNPNINDLLDGNVYKLHINNQILLCPVWLDEIRFFDAELIIQCIPTLEKNMTLDLNNNLIIQINAKISSLLNKGYLELTIGKKNIKILSTQLKIRKKQKYYIYNEGIPIINTQNIYDKSKRAHLIFDIYLS